MICIIHAHPYPHSSRTNRALADALSAIPDAELRPLYDLYPDFDIDVAAEQRALTDAQLIVWMHPLFWYSVPSLMKHWLDKVLTYGYAYGEGGTALHGKRVLWVPTAGGELDTYAPGAKHGFAFAAFAPPLEQTARFCGMHWEEPHVVHSATLIDESELGIHTASLTRRLLAWRASALATAANKVQ